MMDERDAESSDDEEERPAFCPYTRESLLESEARIADEEAKRNERKKKREEGEVRRPFSSVRHPNALHSTGLSRLN